MLFISNGYITTRIQLKWDILLRLQSNYCDNFSSLPENSVHTNTIYPANVLVEEGRFLLFLASANDRHAFALNIAASTSHRQVSDRHSCINEYLAIQTVVDM